jgi:hypothetical protein
MLGILRIAENPLVSSPLLTANIKTGFTTSSLHIRRDSLSIFLRNIASITSLLLMVYSLESYPHIIATLPDEGIPTYKRSVLTTLRGGGRVGNNSPIDSGSTVGFRNSFNCAIDVSSKLWSNSCDGEDQAKAQRYNKV